MKLEQYVKLRDKLTRAEDKLLRATRAWDKARAACRRAEKALDKDFNRRSEIGGSHDIRDMMQEPISEPINLMILDDDISELADRRSKRQVVSCLECQSMPCCCL